MTETILENEEKKYLSIGMCSDLSHLSQEERKKVWDKFNGSNKPLYFFKDKFYFRDHFEVFNALKNMGGLEVSRSTIGDLARKYQLPLSLMAAHAQGIEYRELTDDMRIGFYDIETTEKSPEEFICGVINDKLYNDGKEFIKALKKFDVVAAFNNFRFDNRVLYRLFPSEFEEIVFGDFKIQFLPYQLNIDALFFFYLWQPFHQFYSLNDLATDLDFERKNDDLENKEAKCFEDVQILMKFWPVIKKLYNFLMQFRIDPLIITTLPKFHMQKLRRWLFSAFYIKTYGELPELKLVGSPEEPHPYMKHKKGYYENVFSYDIKSAYPRTAMSMDLTWSAERDFSRYMEFMLEQRDMNPEIKDGIKQLSNAFIGDMRDKKNPFRNEPFQIQIWNTFRERFVAYLKKNVRLKNVLFAYTDGYMTLKEKPESARFEPYDVVLKRRFSWLYIFNSQKYLGFDELAQKIVKIKFDKDLRIKVFNEIDKLVDDQLLNNRLNFMADPEAILKQISLRKFENKFFAIKVYKNSIECPYPQFWEIWNKLDDGFNEVYLGKGGYALDSKKIYYPGYEKIIRKWLKQFKFNG